MAKSFRALGRVPLWYWASLFLALNVVDVIETAFGLRLGAREQMPLYRALLHVAPYPALIPLKMTCALGAVLYVLRTRHWWPSWVARMELMALNAVIGAVVAANAVSLWLLLRR